MGSKIEKIVEIGGSMHRITRDGEGSPGGLVAPNATKGGVGAVFYKVLNSEGYSCIGGSFKWSLPTKNDDGSWTPGEWAPEIEGPLVECRNGYHLATIGQLPQWLGPRIFVAEVDGEIVESSNKEKWVARKVRLVSETAWDERTARLFACDCAEHVLPIYERDYPDDNCPRHAIEVARRYANGEATMQELTAARDAACRAAWTATGDAAWHAAGDAAGAAACAAAWAAACAAAWDAACRAAQDATGAARYAAWAAERKWQAAKLAEYLGMIRHQSEHSNLT